MSVTGWSLVRFVHVLAAMGWVGGQLLLAGVVLPVLRSELERPVRVMVVRKAAKRFGLVANAGLLPLLLITGVSLALHRGVTFATFEEPGYGRLLSIKLVLVLVSVLLAALHGILASKQAHGARALAIAGLASSLAIVVFATALVP